MDKSSAALISFLAISSVAFYFVKTGILDGNMAITVILSMVILGYIFIKDSDQDLTKYNYPL